MVVYNAEETVTTVLYALLASVLKGEPFREVLASLFSEPMKICTDEKVCLRYRALYGRYKRYLEMKVAVELTDGR